MEQTISPAAIPSSPGAPPPSYWHVTAGAEPLAADDLPQSADVVVVGAGLLGACTAYWLARRGARVIVVEREAPGAGATGRNGGFLTSGTAESYPDAIARLGHATAKAIWDLTIENRALARQVLAEEQIACDYREPGHLSLALGAEQMEAVR
ncbi:MAG: FAD-dependent oxidoreductase, partial [Chloroflexota bacterium]